MDPSLLRPCQAHKKTDVDNISGSQADRSDAYRHNSDGESNASSESSRDAGFDTVTRDDSCHGDNDDEDEDDTDCDDLMDDCDEEEDDLDM